MFVTTRFCIVMLLVLCAAGVARAAEGEPAATAGTIFTFWPLVDYRDSPADGFRSLSILGPLFKWQQRGEDRELALRPFFFRTEDAHRQTVDTTYLYPLAATHESPEMSRADFLNIFSTATFRKGEGEEEEPGTQFLPFYSSGISKKYGPYTAVAPFYGTLYERFWRDEIHFVLFPLYSRTVKKGTTTRHFLYPFVSITEGERESGFDVWPLYGQSAKEGVYQKRFVLWPLYWQETTEMDTESPTESLFLLPFYTSSVSPTRTSRYVLWPFFGHMVDSKAGEEKWDILWPFYQTLRGPERSATRVFPFYYDYRDREQERTWYLWPVYNHEAFWSEHYRMEKTRVLSYLFWDKQESWRDGTTRRWSALWPFYVYSRDPRGVKSLSIPAPVEPVLNRDGIDRSWAPFWRLYQQRWNDQGDSAVSFLWNLYWHEVRGEELAYELFPLVAYRSTEEQRNLRFLKGLVGYRNERGRKILSFLWLPFGISWGESEPGSTAAAVKGAGGVR